MARPFSPARRKPKTFRPRSALRTARPLQGLEFLEDRRLLSASPVESGPYFPPQAYAFQDDGFLTDPSTQAPLAIAENYLRSHAADFGLVPSDFDDYIVETNYVTDTTRATTLIIQQSYDGLPVENSTFKITVTSDGRLLSVGGGFVPGLGENSSYVATPKFDAPTSVIWAANGLKVALSEAPRVVGTSSAGRTLVKATNVSSVDVPTDLHYVPMPDGSVRLAWNVTMRTPGEPHQYYANVDATSGDFVSVYDQVDAASYQAFAIPKRSPLDGPRTIITDPQNISPTPAIVPSPLGWHDTNGVPGAEFTVTRGNNTNTYLDRDGDFLPDLGAQPNGGPNLNFTGSVVPLDFGLQPEGNASAAVTNMFYWVNTLHDVHYLYGFNEAAGNFQYNNYGRGGAGFDPVQALVQQSGDLLLVGNAFFFPTLDGEAPQIAMFEWDDTNPRRDGDFDSEIIIHEYGHGVSTRLSGNGGAGLSTLQGGGMGEGWSDFWALMLTQKSAAETINGRGVGNYALGLAAEGDGIRRFRYGWDINDINLETFESYGIGFEQSLEVHDTGELWAATLWDINHLMTEKYGFEPNVFDSTSSAGNIRTLHLVMNALKIQPAAPTFIEARDAILLADRLLYGGADQYEIWTAFARRGLGQFASTDSFNDFEVFTSFDIPADVFLPTIDIGPDVTVTEGNSGTTAVAFSVSLTGFGLHPVTVTYATANGTATAGSDYGAQTGTLVFNNGGPTTQMVTIQAFGDDQVEGNETFFLRLSNPINGTLGDAEAQATIINDDFALSINDISVTEGDTGTKNAVFTVTLGAPSKSPVSVNYNTLAVTATAAVDFSPRNGTLQFSPGATSRTITVPIIGDKVNEPTETFQVILNNASGARIDKSVGQATILDNDLAPSFYVNDVQVTSNQTGVAAAVFTVGLDSPSGQTASVFYETVDGDAIDGTNYQGQSGTLVFGPGVTTRQVTVPVITSSVPAPNKSFFLQLSAPTNAVVTDPQGVGTIVYAGGVEGEIIVDNGDAGFSRSSGWTSVTNTLAFGLDYDYAPGGNGTTAATWTFDGLASGSYQVFTRWVPFTNRATNATYSILDGGTTIGSAAVNQQISPSGELSNGVTWQALGTFQTTTGTLAVRLTNNANGFVIADAVRIVANGIPSQEPEINVSGSSQSIASGDSTPTTADGTDFGSTAVGNISQAHTFSILNTGNASLTLSGSPAVTISGANAGDFAVTSQPATTVQPGGTTTFQIEFHPSAAGTRTATVSIPNNDNSEHPYTFTVQGNGVAALQQFAHNGAMPQDVNDDSRVSPLDVAIVMNQILAHGQQQAAAAPLAADGSTYYVDVNGDGRLSSIDLLMVVNYLLYQKSAASAAPLVGSPDGQDSLAAGAVDVAMADGDAEDELDPLPA